MGTNVRLTRSGGFAGLSMVADVDLDHLPGHQAAEVQAALDGVDFDRLHQAVPRPPGRPDGFQYDLEVDDGRRRSVTAHEPLSDPGFQQLVDVLLPMARPE
jgi:hypothetical protein